MKLIAGGEGNDYRYVFKSGDFVFSTITKDEMYVIREDVKTNDSTYKVKCEKMSKYPTHISLPDEK